ALNRQKQKVVRTKAITDVDLLAVDDEVLDILATWDQVAAAGTESDSSPVARAMITGAFSLGNLRGGAFSQLPAAHIEELLKRFQHVKTARGEAAIREGDEGDFYYVIESARFQVERLAGGAKMVVPDLQRGEVRNMFAAVDRSKEYVAYCESGRRSAAAAFLFAQRGFRVWLLEGGLRSAERQP